MSSTEFIASIPNLFEESYLKFPYIRLFTILSIEFMLMVAEVSNYVSIGLWYLSLFDQTVT